MALRRHVQLAKWLTATRHGRKPALLKAFGMKMRGGCGHAIVDLTAGLGKDAAILASHGASVFAFERNREVFDTVKSSLAELANSNQYEELFAEGGTLTFEHADSLDVLRSLAQRLNSHQGKPSDNVGCTPAIPVDAISDRLMGLLTDPPFAAHSLYIDPMHQPRRKTSAKVKQAMRDVRDTVGHDNDSEQLFVDAHYTAQLLASLTSVPWFVNVLLLYASFPLWSKENYSNSMLFPIMVSPIANPQP